MEAQKPHRRLVVVIPVGPDNNGAETIESVFAYCTPSVSILAIDDSKQPETRHFLETVDPRVTRLPSSGFPGIRGALLCSLAQAYEHALEQFDFDVLLRIDTDALITGPSPEEDALALLNARPRAGMLGAFRVGSDGAQRDFSMVKELLLNETGWHGFRRMSRGRRLRRWIWRAEQEGYELGEHCLGAAVYLRPKMLRDWRSAGDLRLNEFHDSGLSEDHIFSLLTVMQGYTLEEFASGDFPMGVRWRGLPESPADLLQHGKKIVHSIKFYESMKEAEIRAIFATQRFRDVQAGDGRRAVSV